MDDQFSMNDLPLVCIKQILSWITDREHRIYARFVCKLWCTLIDQDCSVEKYIIDSEELYRHPLYSHAVVHDVILSVDFSKIFSMFLNSQRKKTSFHFKGFDFEGSEQFWRTKGAEITSLDLGQGCRNIPLGEIIEHCSKLKSLTFENGSYYNEWDALIEMLEKCISDGKRNFSVRFLYAKQQNLFHINDIAKFNSLVSQIFLGVQKVILEESVFETNYGDINLDQQYKVDKFSTTFRNLKFEITLKNRYGTFIFDPAANVPVQITTLTNEMSSTIDEILTHLSHYSCNCNHLNRLKFNLNNRQNKLDDIQELISQWPTLKEIFIKTDSDHFFIPLTNSLDSNENNIDCLELSPSLFYHPHLWAIDDAFLQFFENLRTFKCDQAVLTFDDFVKLLCKLPHLEKLAIFYGTIDVHVHPVQTISNEKLLELKIPYSFLHKTIAKYDFINLRKLNLSAHYADWKLPAFNPSNVDQDLNRINCPKLEFLYLNFDIRECWKNQDDFTQWMLNILALFPRLIKFLFCHDIVCFDKKDNYMKTADEVLKKILKNHRMLREIGWKADPHKLKILSPSHIKHYYRRNDGNVSVLNVS